MYVKQQSARIILAKCISLERVSTCKIHHEVFKIFFIFCFESKQEIKNKFSTTDKRRAICKDEKIIKQNLNALED